MTPFERRIAALEAAKGKKAAPVPIILRVPFGKSQADALAEFAEQHPQRPRGHGLLIVPAKPSTPEEEADYEARLYERQRKLVADARSERREPVVTPVADVPRHLARYWKTPPQGASKDAPGHWRPNQ